MSTRSRSLAIRITPNARFMTSLKALAEQTLADWRHEAEQLAGRSVNAINLEGVPWDRIVKLVREGGYDLLVLSTHGRTGLKHALIGSVAEKIVRHASCPVFVVR